VQNPGEFVREQVSTVRERVDRVAGSVADTAARSQVGDFIREQRSAAKVSLRELARAAGVSNPYLSQVERGLRKPSAEILQQIAKALRISAETLYVRAGILDEDAEPTDLEVGILRDPHLTERQKNVLIDIYRSFRAEGAAASPAEVADRKEHP
jgi:transcriptional regulator with XRE-family HTH domain